MNEQDTKLAFWNTAICRKKGRTWAEAQVYNNGSPSEFYWLALDYDIEESYEPVWMKTPDGKPTLFMKSEVDDFVSKWLRA